MNSVASHLSWHPFPFPLYVFIFSCLVYLCGRPLQNLISAFVSVDAHKSVRLASGLDQAEKGLKRQDNMSDEDIFQLEKRAFFSKVGASFSWSLPLASRN